MSEEKRAEDRCARPGCGWRRIMHGSSPVDAEERRFAVRGTGHLLGDLTLPEYLGTCFDGPLVWHVFERGRGLSK